MRLTGIAIFLFFTHYKLFSQADSLSFKSICVVVKAKSIFPKRTLLLNCKELINYQEWVELCKEECPFQMSKPLAMFHRTSKARTACLSVGAVGLAVATVMFVDAFNYALNNCIFGCPADKEAILNQKQNTASITGVVSVALFPTAFILRKRKRYIAEVILVNKFNEFADVSNKPK